MKDAILRALVRLLVPYIEDALIAHQRAKRKKVRSLLRKVTQPPEDAA